MSLMMFSNSISGDLEQALARKRRALGRETAHVSANTRCISASELDEVERLYEARHPELAEKYAAERAAEAAERDARRPRTARGNPEESSTFPGGASAGAIDELAQRGKRSSSPSAEDREARELAALQKAELALAKLKAAPAARGPQAADAALTEIERKTAREVGVSEESFLAMKNRLREEGEAPTSPPSSPAISGLSEIERKTARQIGVTEEAFFATKNRNRGDAAPSALSEVERKACRDIGVTEEAFLATKNRRRNP